MDCCTAGCGPPMPPEVPSLKWFRSFIDNKIRVYPPPEVPYSLRVFVASTSK